MQPSAAELVPSFSPYCPGMQEVHTADNPPSMALLQDPGGQTGTRESITLRHNVGPF